MHDDNDTLSNAEIKKLLRQRKNPVRPGDACLPAGRADDPDTFVKVYTKVANAKRRRRQKRVVAKLVLEGFRKGYEAGLTDGQLLGAGVYLPGVGFVLGLSAKNALASLVEDGSLYPVGLKISSSVTVPLKKPFSRIPASNGSSRPRNSSGTPGDTPP